MFDTVIVSGGSLQMEFALHFLLEQERLCLAAGKQLYLVAADLGLDFYRQIGRIPDLVVGDFDSLSREGLLYLQSLQTHPRTEVVRLKPQKDDSDTQSAVHHAMRRGAKSIAILGATGSRVDHFMANLGLLLMGDIVLVDAYNYLTRIESGTVLRRTEQFGTYVSFFPLSERVSGLTLEGFCYPLKGYDLSLSDCGLTVSNEITEETATVTFESGSLLMIMSKDGNLNGDKN